MRHRALTPRTLLLTATLLLPQALLAGACTHASPAPDASAPAPGDTATGSPAAGAPATPDASAAPGATPARPPLPGGSAAGGDGGADGGSVPAASPGAAAGAAAGASGASPSGPAAGPGGVPRPGGTGVRVQAPLTPPEGVGEVRFVTQGCLAEPTRGEAFPAPAPTRSAPGGGPVAVEVKPVKRGVLLSHPLEHACCLTARVEARTEGRVVTVTEQLEGKACRCRCGSTVKSAVALGAGEYTLKLQVREPASDTVRELWQGPVRAAP